MSKIASGNRTEAQSCGLLKGACLRLRQNRIDLEAVFLRAKRLRLDFAKAEYGSFDSRNVRGGECAILAVMKEFAITAVKAAIFRLREIPSEGVWL